MNKENILKNLFWFAFGSFIALIICFNEVYAEAIPINYIGFSGFNYAGGQSQFCWLVNNGVNNRCQYNTNTDGYRYVSMSVTPTKMENGTYYSIQTR